LNLAWVNYNSLSGDDMSKRRNFLQPESTLAEFDRVDGPEVIAE
jgi:hypothetical protein